MDNIFLFEQNTSYNIKDFKKLKRWLIFILKNEFEIILKNKSSELIKKIKKDVLSSKLYLIFCSEEYFKNLNIEKSENYAIINKNNKKICIDGEIYISIGSTRDIAKENSENFETELRRTIILGLLKLLYYNKLNDLSIKEISDKIEFYLNKYFLI